MGIQRIYQCNRVFLGQVAHYLKRLVEITFYTYNLGVVNKSLGQLTL